MESVHLLNIREHMQNAVESSATVSFPHLLKVLDGGDYWSPPPLMEDKYLVSYNFQFLCTKISFVFKPTKRTKMSLVE